MLKGCGERVAPTIPSVLSSAPSGVEKLNFCIRFTKNKKSSVLARLSPRQARLPGGRGGEIHESVCSLKQCFTH